MIEICFYIVNMMSDTTPLLATTTGHDPNIWSFFLFLFIIGSVFAIIVLLSYSKKPDDWQHKSVISDYYVSGKLKDLAESIKVTPVDYQSDTPIKKLVQNLFFEKIRSIRSLSLEELEKLTGKKDRKTLEEIVQDTEIVDWILNVPKNQEKSQGFFKKDSVSKKEQYFMDLRSMVEKMEAWGE